MAMMVAHPLYSPAMWTLRLAAALLAFQAIPAAPAGCDKLFTPLPADVVAPQVIFMPKMESVPISGPTEAYVCLEANVDATGKVTDVRVVKTDHPEYAERVKRLARDAKFKPATRNGVAVASTNGWSTRARWTPPESTFYQGPVAACDKYRRSDPSDLTRGRPASWVRVEHPDTPPLESYACTEVSVDPAGKVTAVKVTETNHAQYAARVREALLAAKFTPSTQRGKAVAFTFPYALAGQGVEQEPAAVTWAQLMPRVARTPVGTAQLLAGPRFSVFPVTAEDCQRSGDISYYTRTFTPACYGLQDGDVEWFETCMAFKIGPPESCAFNHAARLADPRLASRLVALKAKTGPSKMFNESPMHTLSRCHWREPKPGDSPTRCREIFDALISAGSRVDDEDSSGHTPLQVAVASVNRPLATWLLDAGARPDLTGNTCDTILEDVGRRDKAFHDYLVSRGAIGSSVAQRASCAVLKGIGSFIPVH